MWTWTEKTEKQYYSLHKLREQLRNKWRAGDFHDLSETDQQALQIVQSWWDGFISEEMAVSKLSALGLIKADKFARQFYAW